MALKYLIISTPTVFTPTNVLGNRYPGSTGDVSRQRAPGDPKGKRGSHPKTAAKPKGLVMSRRSAGRRGHRMHGSIGSMAQ